MVRHKALQQKEARAIYSKLGFKPTKTRITIDNTTIMCKPSEVYLQAFTRTLRTNLNKRAKTKSFYSHESTSLQLDNFHFGDLLTDLTIHHEGSGTRGDMIDIGIILASSQYTILAFPQEMCDDYNDETSQHHTSPHHDPCNTPLYPEADTLDPSDIVSTSPAPTLILSNTPSYDWTHTKLFDKWICNLNTPEVPTGETEHFEFDMDETIDVSQPPHHHNYRTRR